MDDMTFEEIEREVRRIFDVKYPIFNPKEREKYFAFFFSGYADGQKVAWKNAKMVIDDHLGEYT